jgi:hypothetical protein
VALTLWCGRFGAKLTVLVACSLLSVQAQTLQVPCALAEQINLSSFTLLGDYNGSEAGQDDAAADYAECQSRALTRSLSRMASLSSRMGALRTLYRQLNEADGTLAYIMEGGGTMYSHGIPRSFPDIEVTLKTLAALASSQSGGQTGARYTASIRLSKEALTTRLSQLKGWKPSGDYPFSQKEYAAALQQYQDAANSIMKVLGSRNDAATAAGYQPLGSSLFLDDILNNND